MADDKKPAPAPGETPARRRTAAALRYDVGKDRAPLILASGRGTIADEIVRIAQDNEIPLYEDTGLADLLAKLEIDAEIPPELYVLVAEVLFFVFQLDRMRAKREQIIKKGRPKL